MKKRLLFSLIGCFVIILNTGLYAQDKVEKHGKVGLGVSLFSMQDLSLLVNDVSYWSTIYVPISLSDKYRLEPDFGFVKDDGGEFLWNMGLSFFFIKEKEKMNYYYGVRTGLYNTEYLFVGPAIGAEYFLYKQFSISAEAQLRGNLLGDGFSLGTSTSVMIRFYFK